MSVYSDLVAADGAVWYARLGETSGTAAVDAVAARNGVYQNTPTLGVTGIISESDKAVTFVKASTEYVSVATIPAIVDTFSIELWVRKASISAIHVLFHTTQPQIYLDSGNKIVFDQIGIGVCLQSSQTITDTTTWHHIVATKAGAARHLYLDGSECTYSQTTARTFTSVTAATLADQATPGTYGLNGSLDEVAIYTAALSAATVAAHYTAGTTAPAAAARRSQAVVIA